MTRLHRTIAATVASAALFTGALSAPAQAQPADFSSEAAAGNWEIVLAIPLLGSSLLSSVIRIPQCTLFDTTGC